MLWYWNIEKFIEVVISSSSRLLLWKFGGNVPKILELWGDFRAAPQSDWFKREREEWSKIRIGKDEFFNSDTRVWVTANIGNRGDIDGYSIGTVSLSH